MLINFSIENWLSYRDNVTFSMVASKERQHNERLTKLNKYNFKVLPIAAIYGGNASGKTNFFSALNFVKDFVVEGRKPDKPIPVQPYLLDNDSINKSSAFAIEMLIDDVIYEYSFTVTRKEVIEEKLIAIGATSEKVLFHRYDDKPHFANKLKNKQFLNFAFKGTRPNQLFLTNSVSQNVNEFKQIYDWFKYDLILIGPDSRFGDFELFVDQEQPFSKLMQTMLNNMDTGIDHLELEEIPLEKSLIPENLKNELKGTVKEGEQVKITGDSLQHIFKKENGALKVIKMKTAHRKIDGEAALFEISQESDGTRRILDLLPILFEGNNNEFKKTFIVDEINRSLHPLLTKALIDEFLKNCNIESRKQILLTTHDILLMNQEILRRDEMWITERNKEGVSQIYPLSDFKEIRYDKDIRKSYLQGRFGGVPKILLNQYSYNDCKDRKINGGK